MELIPFVLFVLLVAMAAAWGWWRPEPRPVTGQSRLRLWLGTVVILGGGLVANAAMLSFVEDEIGLTGDVTAATATVQDKVVSVGRRGARHYKAVVSFDAEGTRQSGVRVDMPRERWDKLRVGQTLGIVHEPGDPANAAFTATTWPTGTIAFYTLAMLAFIVTLFVGFRRLFGLVGRSGVARAPVLLR